MSFFSSLIYHKWELQINLEITQKGGIGILLLCFLCRKLYYAAHHADLTGAGAGSVYWLRFEQTACYDVAFVGLNDFTLINDNPLINWRDLPTSVAALLRTNFSIFNDR